MQGRQQCILQNFMPLLKLQSACMPQLRIKRNAMVLQWIKALLSQLHLSWTTILSMKPFIISFLFFWSTLELTDHHATSIFLWKMGPSKGIGIRHGFLRLFIHGRVFFREKRYLILLIIIILNTTENLSQLSTFLSFFSAYFLNTKSVDWIRFYADWNLCMPKRKTSRTFGSGMGRDFG